MGGGWRQGKQAEVLGAVVLIALVGVALRLPALQAGFRTDDYVQLAMLEGRFPIERAPWDLYWFGGRDATETRALIESGYLPWWSDDDHRVAMLRPLSSLLLALDHVLFGHWALGYQLHSMLWLLALLAGAGALLLRVLPTPVALLALLLYAIDEAHTAPAGWIANRSTLVATTLGMLALLRHVRRRETRAGGGIVSALLWTACLAGGEYGLCMVSYLLSYELLGRTDPLSLRLRAAAPATLLAGGYLALRAALGHGPRASGYYLSPFDQPLELATRGVGRLGALLGELSLGIPAPHWYAGPPLRASLLSLGIVDPGTWQKLPSWHLVQGLLGALGLLMLLLALHWLRGRAPEDRPARRWLLGGALGSLLVTVGSLPDSRLLSAASLGASVLLSTWLLAAARAWTATTGARRVGHTLVLGALVVMHVLAPPQRAFSDATSLAQGARAERAQARDPMLASMSGPVLLVTASDFATAAHLPLIRAADGQPSPAVLRLSGAPRAHDLRRVGARAIEVTVLGNRLDDFFAGSLYRPRSASYRPGQRVERPGMTVTVLRTQDGNPSQLRFEFERALDALPVLHAGPTGLQRVELPESGERVRLPAATPATHVRR